MNQKFKTGFANFGNTCFFNSTLQALIRLPKFKDFFIDLPYNEDFPLMFTLKKLINDSIKGENVINPSDLHQFIQSWNYKVILNVNFQNFNFFLSTNTYCHVIP